MGPLSGRCIRHKFHAVDAGDSCAGTADRTLARVAGVKRAAVDFGRKLVVVEGSASTEALVRALEAAGYAPADFIFTMTMYIFDKKVAVIFSQQENFAITIESEEFARTQTNLFEILWSVSLPAHSSLVSV